MHHCIVKIIEHEIFQIIGINQLPLAASVFIAPSVTFTWEINPFRMPPFIAHEVKISAIDSGQSDQTYHLVERHSAGHGGILVVTAHVPVHGRVHQTENHRLVAHQRLIVALDV